MSSEKTPLLSTPSKGGKDDAPPGAPPIIASPTAYFLDGAHRRKPSSFSFYYSKDSVPPPSTRDREEVDNIPSGASSSSEFNSRPVSGKNNAISEDGGFKRLKHGMRAPSVGGDWLSYIARTKDVHPSAPRGDDLAAESGEVGTLLIPRKVPIKVEPKVHLANERTFLAWLHVVVMLGAASVTIVTFAEGRLVDQLFGVILLPVSVAYIFYALTQCKYLLLNCPILSCQYCLFSINKYRRCKTFTLF